MNTTLLIEVYNLGPATRIPVGEGRTFQVEDEAITIFRTRKGEVYATQALCPHREGPLADGVIGEGRVICPLHFFKFDLATGQPIGHECGALKTYSVKLTDTGDLLLEL